MEIVALVTALVSLFTSIVNLIVAIVVLVRNAESSSKTKNLTLGQEQGSDHYH